MRSSGGKMADACRYDEYQYSVVFPQSTTYFSTETQTRCTNRPPRTMPVLAGMSMTVERIRLQCNGGAPRRSARFGSGLRFLLVEVDTQVSSDASRDLFLLFRR